MPRYVALLRGVTPMNAKMANFRRCFEAAGFQDVKTVLASGNVAFSTRAATEAALGRRIEAAMTQHLDRTFHTILRPTSALEALLEADLFRAFRLPANAKRVVTFLDRPHRGNLPLPIEMDGARVLAVKGREAFLAYTPSPRGPVFMRLIQKTFGDEATTRTWDTVRKCAAA
jgi:uncharacterized protein (DUF1697 family)